MKAKILIISGTGFLGTHLSTELANNHNVTVLSKFGHKYIPELSNVSYIKDNWKTADYKSLCTQNNYDKVLLLGWSDHPRSSNEDLFKSFEENVFVNMRIIDSIINYSKSDIYFFSSYGALPNLNGIYSEQSISGYAAGKMAIESYLNTYSNIHMRTTGSLRISNPYGLYQDPLGTQGVLSIFINLALNKKMIPIFGKGGRKDYIHVQDASKKISNLMFNNKFENFFSISEIKSGFLLSVIDIISYINIHIPLLDLIPNKFVQEVSILSDEIKNHIDTNSNSQHKIFSDSVLEIKNWINLTNK
jgi:nucleoside-diphosphate-sugar epimerase